MMKKMHINTAFLAMALLASSGAMPREFRAPLLTANHGYDFDPREKSLWHSTLDADWYSRSAHRAFAAHGTSTGELSQLFFNKSTFRLSNIFENCLVPQDTQYYNPFMRIITINPRVEYRENGVCLSAGLSRSVLAGKGRCGVRVRVPVRAVDTIRLDDASRRDSQTEDVMKLQKNQATGSSVGFGYRFDYLEAMPTKNIVASQVNYTPNNSPSSIAINGAQANGSDYAVIYSPEGYVPRGTRVGVYTTSIGAHEVPTSFSGITQDLIYVFGDGDYTKLAEGALESPATRAANQDKKATLWVVSAHDDHQLTDSSKQIATEMADFVPSYNANTYEWLHDRGYEFDSSRQVGLGDIDIELFYEQDFGDRITGGVSALMRAPSACGSGSDEGSYAGNPYRSHTGNGKHLEVGGGMHFDVEARSWVMLHFDGEYRFALARTEKMCGVPAGTFIKNIGMEQLADVSWHSVVANADVHLCHPQTTDLTGFIGYQFYWKRADTVRYKQSSVESWLGKTYSLSTEDYTVDNYTSLSNTLAAANTEQFAHRIKGGFTYHLSDWCMLSAGGGITFAGQNMPKELDVNVGIRVII